MCSTQAEVTDFSPDVIRDCSNQKRDPVRKHTEYFRSQELIEKRLGDLGSKLSVRDAEFLQAIGKLNSHTGGKEIERMAHELSNFDLLAAQADELILHVTKLERENAALHIELAKQNRCVAIISSFVPHPIA